MNDPLIGAYADDIHPRIAELREAAPVHWWPARDAYLVLRYDDVVQLVRDRTLIGSVGVARRNGVPSSPRTGDQMMIRKEGDDHTRLRRLVGRAFTPAALQAWRDKAVAVTGSLLDAAAERVEIDAIAEFARPLPVRIISEMLGVPRGDLAYLARVTSGGLDSLEPFLDDVQRAAVNARREELEGYIADLVAEKRRCPAADIATALVSAADDGDRLSDEEVRQQVLLLYLAGQETTANLLGNALAHLLRLPDQAGRLRRDPALDANAVEEVLRFDSPGLFTDRRATRPVEVADVRIPAGASLVLGLASANRDPRRWGPAAECLDITRADARDHVAFGGGPHYCLGAALARLEATVALPAILRRFPTLSLRCEPRWLPRVMGRALDTLPISVH